MRDVAWFRSHIVRHLPNPFGYRLSVRLRVAKVGSRRKVWDAEGTSCPVAGASPVVAEAWGRQWNSRGLLSSPSPPGVYACCRGGCGVPIGLVGAQRQSAAGRLAEVVCPIARWHAVPQRPGLLPSTRRRGGWPLGIPARGLQGHAVPGSGPLVVAWRPHPRLPGWPHRRCRERAAAGLAA